MGGCAREWFDAGLGGVRSSRKGVSCAKREACIRRLCSTVVYDYLLTAVFFVSPPSLCHDTTRPALYLRTEISRGVLSLSGLLGCLRNHPANLLHLAFSARNAASRNGKGAYLRRLCSHNFDRQTGKSLLLSLSPFPSPYHPPSISPGLTLFHFSCNLSEALQGSSSSVIYPLAYRIYDFGASMYTHRGTSRLGHNSFIRNIIRARRLHHPDASICIVLYDICISERHTFKIVSLRQNDRY